MQTKIIQINAFAKIETNPAKRSNERLKIFIIDDSKEARQKIRTKVEETCGEHSIAIPQFKEAEDGKKGIDFMLYEAKPNNCMPDLILCDINMPIMDGFSFCKNLKVYPEYLEIPIIFISSELDQTRNELNAQKNKVEAFKTGVIQAYDKSFDQTFKDSLANLLNLIIVNKQNKLISATLIEKDKIIEHDFEMAKRLQTSLLPEKIDFMTKAKISYIYEPMERIGGDFVDYHYSQTHKDKLCFFICDVSGHGVAAAIISSMIKKDLDNYWGELAKNNNPAQALAILKQKMENKMDDNFFTAYIGILDLNTGMLTFARAGHHDLLIIKKDLTIKWLPSKGPAISDYSDKTPFFEEINIQLNPGDKVLLYTDGFIEAANPQGQMIGYNKANELDMDILINWLKANNDLTQSPNPLCRSILQKIFEFAGTEKREDDIALLAIEYLGN